jgi:hypothetical protein
MKLRVTPLGRPGNEFRIEWLDFRVLCSCLQTVTMRALFWHGESARSKRLAWLPFLIFIFSDICEEWAHFIWHARPMDCILV